MIEEIRKLLTSILWDIADIIDFVASEIVCPPTSYEKQERHPEPQYPVGTIWYNRVGDAWRVESNGEWHQVEQDGEPLEPIEERMSKAYEGILPEDDENETPTPPITYAERYDQCLLEGVCPYTGLKLTETDSDDGRPGPLSCCICDCLGFEQEIVE